jgi:thioredoxin 1
MGNAMELTVGNFDQTVSKGVTLVDFWAEWCGPCRMMTPIVEDLAKEYSGKANIGKINVDDESDLAVKFDVGSIPTLIVFKDGQVAQRFVGVTSKGVLADALKKAGA